MTAAPASDLLGTAMVDFAPITAQERALLDLVQGPVLDVGCGPARHARFLQGRGLTAIGLDRSLLALGLARTLGLRRWVHADVRCDPLPPARTALRSTTTSAWAGHRPAPRGSCIVLPWLVGRAGDCW